MMKYLICIIFVFSLIGCKSNNTTKTEIAGKETFENVSCKDYAREFKSAFINVIKNQPDTFFKQVNNSSLVISYKREKSCLNITAKYSTILANEKDNWAVAVHSEKFERPVDCNEAGDKVTEAELVPFNVKAGLIQELKKQEMNMTIDTDRPCHLRIESTKDYLKMYLIIDGAQAKTFDWDFSNMVHPAEISLRLEGQVYKRNLGPIILNENEMKTTVTDCINKDSNGACVSTGRTLKEWIDLNQ